MHGGGIQQLGLVVHPRREIGTALAVLQEWAAAHYVKLVQVPASGQDRQVAEPGEPADCDLIVALGGDGTTLAAIHTAAPVGKPVLGVACGSLGALAAIKRDALASALERVAAGDWKARELPALDVTSDGETETRWAVNDLVIVRQGAGQVSADVHVDGELFIRFAGDGCVVSTPLGSSAYTLAAGGPIVAPGALGLVFTPLAPHGGCCPPLVTGPDGRIDITLEPGHGGARVELDGQIRGTIAPLTRQSLTIVLRSNHASLVELGGEEQMLTGLRRRGLLADSPRILARDVRSGLRSGA